MNKDNEFVMSLANASFHNDGLFKKIEMILKEADEDMISFWKEEKGISEKCINTLVEQAKKGRLNIYFQNILCLM